MPENKGAAVRLYDISLPLQESLAVFSGDTRYRFHLQMSIRAGDSLNVGAVGMSVHIGTHVDAPFHFEEEGASIERLPLHIFVGPAIVIDVRGKESIRCEDLRPYDLSETPRVLFRTDAWTDHPRFPERIPVLALDVPAYLKERGVVLVGLDLPSVDALDSKDLPIHHLLGAYGITILESLFLAETPEGRYELMALPLKIVGGDAAPVRAVLRG